VDNIIVMKDGRITEIGTYHELLAQKGAFAEVLVSLFESSYEHITNVLERNLLNSTYCTEYRVGNSNTMADNCFSYFVYC
jgi:hypothetical protein